ncbi:MAG: translocation/assembly module TamB domain-containing protein, partial [Pseudomonadota bacterium]
VTATGPAGLTAEITGQANVTTYDVDLAFTGAGPAALANRFIAPRTVDGPISFRGTAIGPAALTSLVARAQAPSLTVVVPAFGLVLDPVQATVDLAGDVLTLDVNATARDGGRIAVSGPVTLAPLAADLAIDLDALRISDPNLYDTAVDGRVTVTGPLSGGALIAGRVAPNQTELRIPSTGFATSALSGLVHVNEPFVVRQTRTRAGLIEVDRPGPAVAYGLDLIIDAPNRIFLRGRGLDAELGGQLVVGGTTLAPTAVGGFDLIRGRLDILGRRLTLTEGQASLEGSFDPSLRLVATTQTEDVEVRIVIAGQASSPDIRFESDPELPEDEVLAQLLFGRGIDTLSPLQAAQLASAVATLAGRGGDGIVGRLRSTLGFDDLDVATSETGATDLRIGRYLGENLYTDVTIGSDGRSEVSLNLDLTPSVSVQGSVANDGGSSIGIFYQRDY